MSVYLPLAEETVSESQESEFPGNSVLQHGTESILVVDDEDPVRNVLSVSLLHLGYRVDVASSGKEAIEKFVERNGDYDLVLLDMLMPGYSGDEVFLKFKEIDPDVKVLAISGFTSESSIQRIMDNGGMGFIQKPFTIEELSTRVRQCFDKAEDD